MHSIMILKWYLIGIVIAFIIIFLYNWLYSAKGNLKAAKFSDLFLSLFSWLTIVLSLLVFILEASCKFSSYGQDYIIYLKTKGRKNNIYIK